jgi:DNA-binding MarR family transcriptional regulator
MDAEAGVHGDSAEAGVHGDSAGAEQPENSIEPGMPGNPVRLTDPKMMRALAHPARIAIWSHIGLRGSVTATECAEVAGLSPSACSYHLRTLAKYGFIEEDRAAAANGRERPWRARLLALTLEDRPDSSAGERLASRLLVENLRASAEEVRARYVDRESEYPAEWRAAAGETFSAAHVTPDELNELRAKVLAVMEAYIRLDPAERSPGALPVRIVLDMFPWFTPDEVT